MKSLLTFLETLSLSKTEASIYLSGLKKAVQVDDLVQMLGIKRSTIYHALHTLEAKGLTNSKRDAGKLTYQMLPPTQLKDYIARQTAELETLQVSLDHYLPLFPAVNEDEKSGFTVEHYDNIAGIKKIVDVALNCKDCQWRIIAPRHNFFSQYDKAYADYFLSKRRAHKIKAKTLWESPQAKNTKGSLNFQQIITRNPRYLPAKYAGKFQSVVIIFDDYIAFISSIKGSESLLVRSQEFSTTMAVMFDALWDQSQDFLKLK